MLPLSRQGDGIHNDTAAIQAAFDCCEAGGQVLLPRAALI